MKNCPCGSEKNYSDCCGAFITGEQLPFTPEELMRSRYTAYTQSDIGYIARTMKSPASDHFNPDAVRQWAQQIKWLKLEVIQTTSENKRGFVEFQAHYSHQNKKYIIHEISEFHLENGQWYYVNGKEADKPNFNS